MTYQASRFKQRRWELLFLIPIVVIVVAFLRPIFAGAWIIDPVAVRIGPLAIRWYGIILASAIAIAFEWSRRRLEVRGYAPALTEPILWWAALGGILGARLGFVAQNLGYFGIHPLEVLAYTQGGLSIHGAVVGGAIAAGWAARKAAIPFLTVADMIAPTVLLGTIIGRFGNFMNHELYGYPTMLPWKLFIPLADRLPGFESSAFFHPTFLYEALLNLVMLRIVLRFERTTYGSRFGSSCLLTLTLYSVSRFTVEFFRIGDSAIGGLTTAQLLSLLAIGLATPLILFRSRPRSLEP